MFPLDALRSTGHLVATTRQLLDRGITPGQLTTAVRAGELMRVRRGHYAEPGLADPIARAVRVGGRLSCISALRRRGVWAADDPFPHVALKANASRLRSPANRFVSLASDNRDGITLHWEDPVADEDSTQHALSVVDSLRHVLRCQPWYLAIAAIDSALNTGVLAAWQLDQVFQSQPSTVAAMRERIDSRSESGIESIVRLLLEQLGLEFRVQVTFDRIGRVDLVVAGCLVIETDGMLGHEGDTGQLRDYDRDVALARLGYMVLRFNYRQVMFHREDVVAAIIAALKSHRRFAC